MMKKIFTFLFAFLIILPVTVGAGSFGKGEPTTNPGEWFVGPDPAYIDPNKAPIVFIHGLNSSASTWTDNNNMDEIAFQNGYQTAFINLYATKNMWDNGSLLAEKLREIYQYFGGKKLIIVGHSKGGVDTQSALVHYGAYPYVQRVITLSTPHHGSQLADLAYSSWAGWLADILGSKNDATYSLQTGYMANFRNQTDQHINVSKVPIYTLAGKKWGSFGSSLYWGGLYLSAYGTNDGAVTVNSSRLPYATEIKVGDWNHATIKEGSSTFHLFSPYLRYSSELSSQLNMNAELPKEEKLLSSYYRGGHYQMAKKELFFVEENVEEITVDWLSDKKDTDLTIIDPNGKEYKDFQIELDDSSIFQGAYHHLISVKNPIPGKWTISAYQKEENYLLHVQYKSRLNNDFDLSLNQSDDIHFSFSSNNQPLTAHQLKAAVHVEYRNMDNTIVKKVQFEHFQAKDFLLQSLGEGIYNITIDLQGITNNGHIFNRTFNTSIYMPQ